MSDRQASLIAAIDEAVSFGDKLIFQKNPTGADPGFPEYDCISMTIEKHIPGKGSYSCNNVWDMNIVKGEDSLIVCGIGKLLELLSRDREGCRIQRIAAEEVFSQALLILDARRKSGKASSRPLDRDSLVRLIDAVFDKGEAKEKLAGDE